MIPDADLQVWLNTHADQGRTVVVPYVKSINDMQINYRMDVVQKSASSTSRIGQQGRVSTLAAQPASLAHITLGPQNGECHIEIVLREAGKEVGTYRFDCPRR
jgi:hypothetical protein